jgi:hypothetical protein
VKLFFLTLLIVPLAGLVRSAALRLQPPAPPRGQLDGVEHFAHLVAVVQARLDEAHDRIVTTPVSHGSPGESPVVTAARGVRELEDASEHVRAVFGEGGVSAAADAVVTALVTRLDALEWASLWSEPDLKRLDSARAEAVNRIEQFALSASVVLRDAARNAEASAAGSASS